MDQLLNQLSHDRQASKLILMPVSRLMVESPHSLGEFRIFPPGYVDINSLRPVPNQTPFADLDETRTMELSGILLREVLSSLTGFSVETLAASPLVGFVSDIDWTAFLTGTRGNDIEIIQRLSRIAERAFDIVRLNLCRLDLPETLPGVVGSWDGSGPYLGAMVYTLEDHESYLIAAETEFTIVSKGIGLDFDYELLEPIPSASDGEVAAVAIHALTLFSDAMRAGNDTIKFLRIMTLFEFLASPDEYRNWKKLKGDILCHCANNKKSYHKLAKRFKEFTSVKDSNGSQRGLRTLVVHHGKFLEDIMPNNQERKSLFLELQGYCSCVLHDMLENKGLTWLAYVERRNNLKRGLEI